MTRASTSAASPLQPGDLNDRPSADPVVLAKDTEVTHPDTGEKVTLAAGTQLSDATALRLGIKTEIARP